ncbi:hypothetical protein IEO21_08604 [Rhodonia placenta]|uniref:Uncharacterized protein n=1 Tax=Rhodonia placenta TaxID=104341 RepID=A0A8H7TZ30_9APHY|nr:hypothetical protein IEO21_08604 [Postia placenta]
MAAELRHITSNTNLVSPARERRLSNRNSQLLRTHRLGSRSPSSIPSSPTSVHSSSSAIFERDIEPIAPACASLSTPTDPHRIPRGRITEQIEHSVPSVLDSAVVVLTADSTDPDELDSISIIAPALPDAGYRSGFTSPISRMSSRSPSPSAPPHRRSLLLSASPPQSTSPLTASPPLRPTVHTVNATAPAPAHVHALGPPATPTSAYFSAASSSPPSDASSASSSPTTATHTEHPLHTLSSPSTAASSPAAATPATVTVPPPASPHTYAYAHPPSPAHTNKRLSFLSYMDLLSSTPASTLPLSSLTGASAADPPHLPSVLGLPQAQYAASSAAGSVFGGGGAGAGGDNMLDDVGGEWEREGLGRGLEERLEALNAAPSVVHGRA